MIRETIAADLLAPLAPLLASLLVVLASRPALAAVRLRLAPSCRGVRWPFRPQASLGLVPQRRALLGRRLDEPKPRFLFGETPAGFPLPLLSVRRLKARPS
jgi:hypothetical protein